MTTEGAWQWIDDNYGDRDFSNLDTDRIIVHIQGKENPQLGAFLDQQQSVGVDNIKDAKAVQRLVDDMDEPSDVKDIVGEIDSLERVFQSPLREDVENKSPDIYADQLGGVKTKAGVSQIMAQADKAFDGNIPEELISTAEGRREEITAEQEDKLKDTFREFRDKIEGASTPEEAKDLFEEAKKEPIFTTIDKVRNKKQLRESLKKFKDARVEVLEEKLVPEESPEFETSEERKARE